jgi:hypothetical protein
MVLGFWALLMVHGAAPAPVAQAAPRVAPGAAALTARKAHMVAEARALLARAEARRAAYRPVPGRPSRAELDASTQALKGELDSMSEIGETEQLRMQMAMERLSKAMAMLSNVLKKLNDTAQGITQNMK